MGEIRDYLTKVKEHPEVYEQVVNFAADYVPAVSKYNAFQKGQRPSNETAKKLLEKAGISLDDNSIDSLLLAVADERFQNRLK